MGSDKTSKTYLIYVIVNKQNGKMYVGRTGQSLHKRWLDHKNAANGGNRHTYLTNAIKKYGRENFYIYPIDSTKSLDKSYRLEQKYIRVYKSHQSEFGYNTTLGGEGVVSNESTRLKRSEAQKGKTPWWIKRGVPHPLSGVPMPDHVHKILHRKGRKAPNLGIPHTETTKKAIGKANRLPISSLQVKNLLEGGMTILQAAQHLGVTRRVIDHRLRKNIE